MSTNSNRLQFAIDWLSEPELGFGGELTHIDPKVGIAAAGPWSKDRHNHPPAVTAGFIGTGRTIDAARWWLARAVEGVDGDADHHPFPGYQTDGPFASRLRLDGPEGKITAREVRELTRDGVRRRSGFETLLGIIDAQLKRLGDLDAPPDFVFVALPLDITKRYWSVKTFRKGVETVWNLRAGIKATAMQRGVRTQLLTQATLESSLDEHTGDLEHPADLAWNLFAGLYFKAGGFPWTPVGLPEGTCHLGITFYRPHGEFAAMRTSVAQAFAENGEAFVLRGNRFSWEGKWPHLPADEAARLAEDVIDRYTAAMGRAPRRLVVHKQSRFFREERAGLENGLKGYEYDLVSLAPSTAVRVMRHGQYPPPRGACVTVGDRRYLYTTGFVPSLARYPHGHVPAPVQITDHVGDSSPRQLLGEVLLLTKMNWNSARFAERVPVTLRFANEVGSILRDLPRDFEPEARYAFYM
jgi:hypothetical protein